MSGYTEACGTSSADSSNVATGGINNKGLVGYWKRAFWVADDFLFASTTALKDQSTLDAAVVAGNAIYLGEGKFEDQSTEKTFFEDADLEIKIEQTAKIQAVRFTLAVCACTASNLEKMEAKTGRVIMQTSTGYIIGRNVGDGTIQGRPVSSISVDNSIPVSETPVSYTYIDITFADAKGDLQNPYEAPVTWLFSAVEQVYDAEGTVSNVSSNGSTLIGTVAMTQGCSTAALTGWLTAQAKAVDVDGNVLTIASFVETSGSYALGITTALTLAYVSIDGIKQIDGGLYYISEQIRISTT